MYLAVGGIRNINRQHFIVGCKPQFVFRPDDVLHDALPNQRHLEEHVSGLRVVLGLAQEGWTVPIECVRHKPSDWSQVAERNPKADVRVFIPNGIDNVVSDRVGLGGFFLVIGSGLGNIHVLIGLLFGLASPSLFHIRVQK